MFNTDEDNSKVYQDLGFDIIEAAVSGFNSTIFAYGQTASGKTHTMMGDDQQKGTHFLNEFSGVNIVFESRVVPPGLVFSKFDLFRLSFT